ncbi:MAG: fibronectin type III domain-containing protein [Bacteroidales bacterium]|nr:fibronectin type III domain-containing protein [Bacteroidales bacterium]
MKKSRIIWCLVLIATLSLPTEKLAAQFSCPPVSGITLSSVTEHTAEITWTAGGNETQWLYLIVEGDSTSPSVSNDAWMLTTSDTLYLDSLSEGLFYRIWVKAQCDSSTVSAPSHVDLWTDCHGISSFPYVEDFNNPELGYYHVTPSSGKLPHCWINQQYAQYLGSSGILRFFTSQSLRFEILPRLADNVPISHLKMTFSYRNPYNDPPSTLFIGVMDDPFDISTFVPLDSATTPYNNWGWHQKEVLFENYTGNGRYIAMKYHPYSVNYFDVDNLVLDMVYNCHDPYNVMATSISPGTAFITWDDEVGEDEWEVAIVPDYYTEPDSSQIVTVHQSEYHATNINDTNLVFFVRTHCSNGWGYSDWVSIPVTSFAYQPATVPYSHNFETGNENAAWRMETGNPASRWQIGIPNGYSDSLLFVTNNGTDASYGSTMAEAWAYRDFLLSGATEYEFKFKWLCNGHSSYAYMQALVGPPAPIPAFTYFTDIFYPERSVTIGNYALQNDWQTARYVLGSENDNTVQRLYFRWRNAYNSVYLPGAIIDHVEIIPYHCVRPSNLTLDFVDDHDAIISFSPTLNEISTWEYVVLEGDSFPDDTLPVLTTSYTSVYLSGLSEKTSYTLYIRGVCSNGSHSSWAEFKFKTKCSPLVLPYVETFDVTGDSKFECWSFPAPETGMQRPSIYKPTHDWEVDTNPVLRFSGIGHNHALAILPEMPSNYSLNSLRLSFLIRTNTDNIHLIVGVMSDPDDFSTFSPVDTVQTVEPFYIDRKEVYFDQYQGSGTYIAILSDYVGDNTCHLDVDDLVLEIAPTCLAPSGLKAINMGQNSVTLLWTPANNEQAWEIAYGTDDFNPDSTVNIYLVNTNPFTLAGLTDGTFYGFYVRALCSSGEYSEWSQLGYAFTRCAPISVDGQPYQESFDSYTTGISASAYSPIEYPYISYPACWSLLNLHALVGYPDGTLPAAFLSNRNTLIVYGNSLHLVNSKVTPLYAVLPEFVEHLRFLKLTFSYKYSPQRPHLSVGYMTDPSDGSTYHEVQFCTSSNSNNFTTLTINYSMLGLNPDSNYYIAFRAYDSVSGWMNAAIENVKVELIPNAFPAPTQLNVSDITTHSAVLDWTNGNDENRWVVQYRPATNPDWTDSVVVFSHPVFLDSLVANTTYDVRVKSIYGNSHTMSSAHTATAFTTLDDTTSVPDYDDFGQHVAIRPNPAMQYIDVVLDEDPVPCLIELYDSQSRKVGEMSMEGKSARIPLGHLASGVYFVQIKGDNIRVTKKLIKE